MGPGIIIPVVVLSIVLPAVTTLARRRFKHVTAGLGTDLGSATDPSVRLTSDALRALATPPWRVVHEIAPARLGGIDHVVIGPPGVLALTTTIDPLPPQSTIEAADPSAVAKAAILRGELDDALRRCAMTSDRLVVVHWAGPTSSDRDSVEPLPGVVAVRGRSLRAWLDGLDGARLSPAQVDLAWQTVVTAIGRPDPLA
jgi:hypothetical protein